MAGLAKAARAHGLKATGVQVDREALRTFHPPALAWVDGNHYVAVLSTGGDRAVIYDPNETKETPIETEELLRRSGGVLLLLSQGS
jgi:ABC-type bacteriocin/lantibiotic exporter with double-glycine peptidase domain